jgi:hypothetical protein
MMPYQGEWRRADDRAYSLSSRVHENKLVTAVHSGFHRIDIALLHAGFSVVHNFKARRMLVGMNSLKRLALIFADARATSCANMVRSVERCAVNEGTASVLT